MALGSRALIFSCTLRCNALCGVAWRGVAWPEDDRHVHPLDLRDLADPRCLGASPKLPSIEDLNRNRQNDHS